MIKKEQGKCDGCGIKLPDGQFQCYDCWRKQDKEQYPEAYGNIWDCDKANDWDELEEVE